jgi:hypothetical protein
MKASQFLKLAILSAAAGLTWPLWAQTADLPIRPGLWDTHVSVNGGAPVAGQYCFSAGTTLGSYLTATNKGVPGTQCSVTNRTQTAHGIAFDDECSGANLSSKGRIDFQSPDAEHFSGSSRTKVSGEMQSRPVNMEIDRTFTAKFAGPDCGSVKPMVVAPAPRR